MWQHCGLLYWRRTYYRRCWRCEGRWYIWMLIFIPFRRGVLMYFPPYFIPLCDKYTIMIFVQCTMYIIRSLALGISIFIHIFVIQQTVNSFTQKPSTPREREKESEIYICQCRGGRVCESWTAQSTHHQHGWWWTNGRMDWVECLSMSTHLISPSRVSFLFCCCRSDAIALLCC